MQGRLLPTGLNHTRQRPLVTAERRPCAREIIERLGAAAYRRPLTERNLAALLTLYDAGGADGGFEPGVRMALEGMLASPHFVFRFEEPPVDARPTASFSVTDHDLASRLSFFIWATGPDDELVRLATANRLSEPGMLETQVRRMLGDPRSEALATRFAAQWLRLPDLEKMHPDVRSYPDFDEQLKQAMRRETELFFEHLVRADRSLLELLTADYTFVNERLAKHYGIANVAGAQYRRVTLPVDGPRGGLLGHGSILTLTSHAGHTSPVLRGKWVMEVLLGSPPPPPPPKRARSRRHGRGRRWTTPVGARAYGATSSQPSLQLVSSHDGPDRARAGALLRNCTVPGQFLA